jgi:hypothetical protein
MFASIMEHLARAANKAAQTSGPSRPHISSENAAARSMVEYPLWSPEAAPLGHCKQYPAGATPILHCKISWVGSSGG